MREERKPFDPDAVVAGVSIARAIAAVEQALVDRVRGRPALMIAYASGGALWELAAATCAALASRFLAVGTPRSIGLVGDNALAARCLDTHAAYFAPREVRRADITDQDAARAACAADIVCVCDDAARIDPTWLRAGTHVNLLRGAFTQPPAHASQIRADVDVLATMVAGRVDGRQLDELTLFVVGAPDALSVAELAIAAEGSSRRQLE